MEMNEVVKPCVAKGRVCGRMRGWARERVGGRRATGREGVAKRLRGWANGGKLSGCCSTHDFNDPSSALSPTSQHAKTQSQNRQQCGCVQIMALADEACTKPGTLPTTTNRCALLPPALRVAPLQSNRARAVRTSALARPFPPVVAVSAGPGQATLGEWPAQHAQRAERSRHVGAGVSCLHLPGRGTCLHARPRVGRCRSASQAGEWPPGNPCCIAICMCGKCSSAPGPIAVANKLRMWGKRASSGEAASETSRRNPKLPA